jgi:hypothetical protein
MSMVEVRTCAECSGRIVYERWVARPRERAGRYGICRIAKTRCENGHEEWLESAR